MKLHYYAFAPESGSAPNRPKTVGLLVALTVGLASLLSGALFYATWRP